jgi:hypothetical protein
MEMRKSFAVVLMFAVALVGIPLRLLAAAKTAARQQGGSLNGVAHGADKAPLPNYTVQVRNVDTGRLAGSTTSNEAGQFSFTSLQPGNYVIEIVDASGKVVGLSPSVGVAAGATVSVTVSASAAGAIAAAASSGGFSLFGLGPLASVAVIGAAGAAAVTAVVATKEDASPSR